MRYLVNHTDPVKQKSDCLIVGIYAAQQFTTAAKQIDQHSGGYLSKLLAQGDLTGELGQTLLIHHVPKIAAARVLLVGCGKESEQNEFTWRKVLAKAVAVLRTTGAQDACNYLTDLAVGKRDIAWKVRQAIEITADGLYNFNQFKTKRNLSPIVLHEMHFNVAKQAEMSLASKALHESVAIVGGIELAKNLSNLPANICSPTYLAQQASDLAKHSKLIKTEVLEEKDMHKLGMGALLAVTQGSTEPAKLIVVKYTGANKKQRPVVLVGKGVTFDSGGISLKPAVSMEEMKFDMCGAASVLGTIKAIAELKLPINVVGIIPTTENMPDGGAIKPGDIVTTMSGQTVEILNTDAEGRLILCDALTYCEKFDPITVIDIATLTGAIILALGSPASGIMSNNKTLEHDLLKAGDESWDRVWPLPLWEDYQEYINSNVADIANISGNNEGKSIVAACFLSRFTQNMHWAHLDVAGTASKSGREKTATGRPVPLLVRYLLGLC